MNKHLIWIASIVGICFSVVFSCTAIPEAPVINQEPGQAVDTGQSNPEPEVVKQEQPARLSFINAKTYTIKRTFSITNGSAAVNTIGVWLPMIADWESQKIIAAEPATLTPASSQKDGSTGTGMDYWEFRDQATQGKSLSFSQQYTVKSFEVKLSSGDPFIVAYDHSTPEYAMYTRAEKLFEADSPEIISTARKVAGNETSPYRMAKLYYEYVNNYMNYQLIEGIGGALFALKKGYGECGDYAALFVALCRASGIPARPVVGRWALREHGEWHVWAEFYLQDVGWVPVDPSFGPKNHADTFGKLDNGRLIFNKVYNIKILPEPQWIPSSTDILQTYYWEYWCNSGDAGSVKVELSYESSEAPGN